MVTTLPDNWFRDHNPEEIITQVAKTTLTIISLWNENELRRVGWLDNPIIDILYSMTSSGVWIARTDVGGLVTEGNSTSINARALESVYNGCRVNLTGYTSKLYQAIPKVLLVPITLVGGAIADQAILGALAGYFGVIKITGIISDTNIGACVLSFEDEDNTDLEGLIGGAAEVNLVANTVNTQLTGMILHGTADNKALEVDITGGAGVEEIMLQVEGWYET